MGGCLAGNPSLFLSLGPVYADRSCGQINEGDDKQSDTRNRRKHIQSQDHKKEPGEGDPFPKFKLFQCRVLDIAHH